MIQLSYGRVETTLKYRKENMDKDVDCYDKYAGGYDCDGNYYTYDDMEVGE